MYFVTWPKRMLPWKSSYMVLAALPTIFIFSLLFLNMSYSRNSYANEPLSIRAWSAARNAQASINWITPTSVDIEDKAGIKPVTLVSPQLLFSASGSANYSGREFLASMAGFWQAPFLTEEANSIPGLRVVDGKKYPLTDAGIQSAINDVGPRGTVLLPPGVYTLANEIQVKNLGVTLQGYGMGTRLLVNNATSNIFNVSGQLFMLRDMEIYTTLRKTGGAIIAVNALQGKVSDVRLVGNFYDGFDLVGHDAGGWIFSDISVPGGVSWNRLFFLQSDSGTVASTEISSLHCSNKITWRDACVVLDSGVDTFLMSDSEFGGPAVGIFCRNSLHTQAPRWVQIRTSYMEGGFTGTILKLDAVRDFRYEGYLASGAVGLEVGPEAKNVNISDTIFVNFAREAVRLHRGSIATSIANNTFEDSCDKSSNDCDTISVDPGASDFRIESNDFRSSQHSLPRYNINVSDGNSSNYNISNNRFANVGTDGLKDGGNGHSKVVGGNVK